MFLINKFRLMLKRYKLRKMLSNEMESIELRNYFDNEYGISVGMYSYGCFDFNRIPRGTSIGRYCSFAASVRIFNGNHGIDYLSLHPYLYNKSLNLVNEEKIKRTSCVIEDDVWVGYGAIITPSVNYIGRGAVIGAGAVVTKSVPKYAIVAGNPAKVIKYRFEKDVIDLIEKSQWWFSSKEILAKNIKLNESVVFNPSKLRSHHFEN